MEPREQLNTIVGRDESGDYYVLDCVFDDADNFKGAVGSVFRPISTREKEETMNIENAKDRFADLWAEAAKDGRTEDSLEDYVEQIIAIDGEDAFFDFSYYDIGCKIAEIYNSELPDDKDKLDKAEFSECVGGGRCFNHKIKWAKVYDQKALELALSYEKE